MTEQNKIKVSIIIPTYNHEKFIAKAIESAIKQKTNFNFEIVIGDDCSSDNNMAIIESYAQQYPNIISFFSNTENKGVFQLVKRIYGKLKGEYFALLEGDDDN